jgi:3-methyladenine DNA glycosylase AlkC
MNLNNLISFLILEDKFSDALTANPEIAPVLQGFKGIQPKYLPWLVKQIKTNEDQNWDAVKGILDKFEVLASKDRLKEKDINRYKTIKDVEEAVKSVESEKSNKEKREEVKSGATKIYEDSEWLIIEPETMEASCYYGYGTKWCISATESNNYFKGYQSKGVKFVFAIRKKTQEKYAYSVSSAGTEIYDTQDDLVAITPLNNKIIKIINDYMKKKHKLSLKAVDYRKLRYSDMSPEQLLNLFNSTDSTERKYMFLNNNFPIDEIPESLAEEMFLSLSEDDDTTVGRWVAANPNTPLNVLSVLANDAADYIREGVASNPSTPPDALRVLANDEDRYVRQKVAANPNTPLDVLHVLSKDKDSYVRQGVAENPNTPLDVLRLLAKDKDSYVRRWVADQPNTPLDVLHVLSKDKDRYVRQDVAKNPNTPLDVLRILAKDKDTSVRLEVAKNPNTPLDVLRLLAKDKDSYVRKLVAKNPNTPLDALHVLSKDKDRYVRQGVAENPNMLGAGLTEAINLDGLLKLLLE